MSKGWMVVLALLIGLAAATAEARCIKCDQSTSYRCYASIYGTKINCDSPSDAGCFTWGVCTPASDGCGDIVACDPLDLTASRRWTDDLQIASVSVTTPVPKSA